MATPQEPVPPPFETLEKNKKKEFFDGRAAEDVQSDLRAQAGRKKLAEQTKAFRAFVQSTTAIPDEQLMGQFGLLLKAYQQEVDSLTRRARGAESALQYLAPWAKATFETPPAAPVDNSSKFLLQIEALNETLEDKEIQVQVLRAERDKLAANAAAAEKTRIDLAEEMLDTKKEIEVLQVIAAKEAHQREIVQHLQQTVASLQTEVSTASSRADQIAAESQKRHSELEKKCVDLEESLYAAEERADAATSKANESVYVLKQKDEELDSRSQQLQLLQEQLTTTARLNESQTELAKAVVLEENQALTDQLQRTQQDMSVLHKEYTALQEELTKVKQLATLVAAPAPSPTPVVTRMDSEPDLTAVAATVDPQPVARLAPLAPNADDAKAAEDEDDAWGWKDEEPAVSAGAAPLVSSSSPAPTPSPPVVALPAPASTPAVVPNALSSHTGDPFFVPDEVPSPVKPEPQPTALHTRGTFSAAELQSNMAQLMLKPESTEEELDKLEDMHHDQLRKITRARWQLIKRQMLGHGSHP